MFSEILRMPFAAVGVLHRWSNDAYRRAMAGFWGFALLYLGTLWVGAALDLMSLIVGAMWVATFLAANFYLQPAVAGLLGGIEALRRGDDPARASVVRGGLWVFVAIVSAGGIALIANAIDAAEVFPFAILVALFVISCAILAGGAQLDRWLKRIAALAGLILLLATVGALHPALFMRMGLLNHPVLISEAEKVVATGAEENYRAADKKVRDAIRGRFAQKMESGQMSPEDWATVEEMLRELHARGETNPLAAADKEIRAQRDAKRREWIMLIQRCRVTEANVVRFTPEQQEFYRKRCGATAAARGITTDEVRGRWPELFGAEGTPMSSSGTKKTVGYLWREFMSLKDTNFWLWLLLVHLIFLPLYWPIKWVWKKYKGEGGTSSQKKKNGRVWFGVIAILALALFVWRADPIGAIAQTPQRIAWRNASPAAPTSINEVGALNTKSTKELVAVIGGDFVGTGVMRGQRDPVLLAIKEGSYLRHDQVYLRICATDLCRSDDPPEESDVVFGGRCELLLEVTRRRCTGTWQIVGRGFVRNDLTFELISFPTGVTIDAYRPNQFGRRDSAFTLQLLHNPRKVAASPSL